MSQKPCNVSHPRRMNSLATQLQKPWNSTFYYFPKNNSHCWPRQIMHCHQWSLTTSNNVIPSKKFYHICVSRISLMMCPACWRAYKHKIIHYNCVGIAIMSIFFSPNINKVTFCHVTFWNWCNFLISEQWSKWHFWSSQHWTNIE